MQRTLLKSKIHRATVTRSELHYQGSVSIDVELLRAADLVEHEQVDVLDVTNGARITTYVIAAPSGSGEICINGAAAHLIHPGDLVIIASYGHYYPEELAGHQPKVILVDHLNQLREGAVSLIAPDQVAESEWPMP